MIATCATSVMKRHVVHLHGERHSDDLAICDADFSRQVAVEEIGMPEEARADQ